MKLLRKYAYFKKIIAVVIILAIFYLFKLGLFSDLTYIGSDFIYSIKNPEFKSDNPDIKSCKGCNVIIISLDTLRADRLGIYGYKLNTSPNIDKFAEESIIFNQAFVNAYFTLPSHMSIFTSLYPLTHKINDPGEDKALNTLSEEYKTAAEILKDNGYKTAWIGSLTDTNLNLNRGFERGFDNFYKGLFDNLEGFNKKRFNDIINDTNKKFFWFVHSYINHAPYIYQEQFNHKFSNPDYAGKLPKNFDEIDEIRFLKIKKEFNKNQDILFNKIKLTEEQSERLAKITNSDNINELKKFINDAGRYKFYAAFGWDNFLYYETIKNNLSKEDISELSGSYDNGVYYMDYLLNEFFEELKKHNLWNNTIIIITSDHGEELFEHKGFDHSNFYDHTIHVPIIIRIPDQNKIELNELAQSIDILPTLLGRLGIRIPPQLEGKDYIKIIQSKENRNEYVYGYSLGDFYIRSKKWKYIQNNNGSEELYYLLNDPEEQNNLIEKNSIILNKIKSKLKDDLEKWIVIQNKK